MKHCSVALRGSPAWRGAPSVQNASDSLRSAPPCPPQFAVISPGERRAVKTYTGDAWRAFAGAESAEGAMVMEMQARVVSRELRVSLERGDMGFCMGSTQTLVQRQVRAPLSPLPVLCLEQVGPAHVRDCRCAELPFVPCPPRNPGVLLLHAPRVLFCSRLVFSSARAYWPVSEVSM